MEKKRWSRWSEEDRSEAIRMYQAGSSTREIAEWLGRPIGSVYSVLTKAEVSMRPLGRSKAPA